MQEHQLPVARACRVVRLSRTAYYQPPMPASRHDAALIAALIPEGAAQAPQQEHVIVMLQNFFDELRRRVPLGK